MNEVSNENPESVHNEREQKIPEGSGYEGLVKKSEGTALGATLERLYPEFVRYLESHSKDKGASRNYGRVIDELNSENLVVIKALAGILENELTSFKYREENSKILRKDKTKYPDPRFPRNKHRKVSAEEKFRIQTGERVALVKTVKSLLGFRNNPKPEPGVDYRAEAAVALNDIGVALMKNPLRQMGKVVPFSRTA